LVAFQTQDAGGPVDVSLNTIVNGATPDQLLSEPIVTIELESGVAVKDATGAAALAVPTSIRTATRTKTN